MLRRLPPAVADHVSIPRLCSYRGYNQNDERKRSYQCLHFRFLESIISTIDAFISFLCDARHFAIPRAPAAARPGGAGGAPLPHFVRLWPIIARSTDA
jgi:hypothetical protein